MASRPKRVVIIGGGVGGMEAARVASLRGHHVTLFEKSERLGGQIWLSAIHPLRGELGHIIHYLKSQLEKLPVKIYLQREATPELIHSLDFDILILATGANPITPNIPGLDKEFALYAHQVLAGDVPSGSKIVIGGAGLVGAEVADFLGERGKKVSLIEMLDLVMQDDETLFRPLMLHRMKKYGVEILTQPIVKEVDKHHVIVEREGKRMAIETDQFVIAMGYVPDEDLYLLLKKEFDPEKIHLIGDCKKPRKVIDAIYEGHLAGLMV
jgi:NADPH-dependent 2,4-dienoyl-CoA reductase/sulfur reductase-like enzyme